MCRSKSDGGRRCTGHGWARANTTPVVQSGPVNVATGDDLIAVQVGQLGGPSGRGGEPVTDQHTGPEEPSQGTTTNIRCGNARVGMQADVITGGITIRR